jgi:hypothetical protein
MFILPKKWMMGIEDFWGMAGEWPLYFLVTLMVTCMVTYGG